MALTWLVILLVLCVLVAFFNVGLLCSTTALALYLLILTFAYGFCWPILLLDTTFVFIALFCNITSLRRKFFTNTIFNKVKKILPTLSDTERQALEAGTITYEGEFFKGAPCFDKLLKQRSVRLSKEEQEFLDGPVEELCHMLDDYQIFKEANLPPNAWQFIKDKGFLSMIIPKRYGGKEFSAWAHAAVLVKLASRNVPAAITVGVPNSLGPAELLLRYGTKEQKDFYLPRLASGEEIPCFALTGPQAGSDAASIPDYGIISYGEFNKERVLGIMLNWDKRYITLAPMATLIGLAFKLRDPDGLFSHKKELGITCALIPSRLKGINIGRRHNPLNTMFQNGPTSGKDVFIPLDFVIGGEKGIGHGWRMLMECLGVGRAITLPSVSSASAMTMALASGCYCRIRHQFGLAIGNFEGIKEALAHIAATAYVNLSALKFVVGSVDEGARPSVASAIVKYFTTARARISVNHGMDIHGGKGICLGPKNYLQSPYMGAPLSITVEGANILTRSLIIFGQGSIRCHPYIMKEMKAIADGDVKYFDQVLLKHMGHLFCNASRALVHGFTFGWLVSTPKSLAKRHYQKLGRYGAAFALYADVITISLGAKLKRKESLSGRLADVVGNLYVASACLKRFHDDGEPKEDLPIIDYICHDLFFKIEQNFKEIARNLPFGLGIVLRPIVSPIGFWHARPNDNLRYRVSDLVFKSGASFDRLTDGIFLSKSENNHWHDLIEARAKIEAATALEKKVQKALKQNLIFSLTEAGLIDDALAKGIIDSAEHEQLKEVAKVRAKIIAVDDFAALP